jgi:hypothetical protein
MAKVKLSVDVESEVRRRVGIAAASRNLSMEKWVEEVLERALREEGMTTEDLAWMEGDLSRLGEVEPYDWREGEMEEERSLHYEPGVGISVEGGKDGE